MSLKPILLVSALAAAAAANADTVAGWTFETLPTTPTATGLLAENGTGTASINTGGTLSSPAGNGSDNSLSSTGWNVGEYFQFSVSTTGFTGVSVSFDQTGSNTGPKDFKLAYSTNGTTFTDVASYTVLPNGAPNSSWGTAAGVQAAYNNTFNLSSVSALNNAGSVTFRLINTSTAAINGTTVASGGTGRVDNFVVSANPVPEPASMAALGLGAVAMIRRRRSAK